MNAVSETISIRKMTHKSPPKLEYELCGIGLNEHLGKHLKVTFHGKIECIHCGRSIKKTFNQGYCYPCFSKLARCDVCIVKPELCHYRHGTCREPKWGEENCLRDHVVYLANTTSLKVGITKSHQTNTRWGDQGAAEALVMAQVPERYLSGLVETEISKMISDKTDWRGLVKGRFSSADLLAERKRLGQMLPDELKQYLVSGGEYDSVHQFSYPVLHYPDKARTFNLDKTRVVEGEFHGIRGQYLFVAGGALNMRKYAGYQVELELLA